MRHLILLLSLALITSCRSHKELQSNSTLEVDSVARSEHHRTIAVIDSIVRNIDFSFDTLKINIERHYDAKSPEFSCQREQNPNLFGVMPSAAENARSEIIRLTATNGRVIDRRRVYRDSVEAFNQLDTVAYKKSAAEASTEHTATTRLYNPPDGTVVSIFAILGIACLIYLFFRKK